MAATTAPAWVAAARARATCAPAAPRMALLLGGERVGSVDGQIFNKIGLQRLLDKRCQLSIVEYEGAPAWALAADDATAALNDLALTLRAAGHCGPWRDEQLAVCAADGRRLATVERGAARVLGLATQAVHLVGCTADGAAMWVQQRAHSKASNPGMWDTLMGGMVSAADTLHEALARETWEEAGLRVAALHGLRHGGHVDFGRESREGGGAGYMRERIDWFCAEVPEGLAPDNQDGEVERFDLLAPQAVRQWLAQGRFTLEAGLVIAAFLGL